MQNVSAVVGLLPIYFLYYKTNLAVNVGQIYTVRPPRDWSGIVFLGLLFLAALTIGLILRRRKIVIEWRLWGTVLVTLAWIVIAMLADPTTRISYFLFLVPEAFVFLLLIWHREKDNPLWYLTWGIAMLCPLITVGTAADFCMRASIPVVFVMMILCMRCLLAEGAHGGHDGRAYRRWLFCALVVVLVLGAVTPTVEFIRGAKEFMLGNRACDWVYTFDQIFDGPLEGLDRNFIAERYRDTFFYQYLAK